MKSNQEKDLRLQLRANRQEREALTKLLADTRAKKLKLVEERDKIHKKAVSLGIEFGKKATA